MTALRNILLFLFSVAFMLLNCTKRKTVTDKPKLIVTITIDGLRADLLDRYDSAFTGGFRRLRDQGLRYTNAWTNHAVTVSHAGHVSIATGLNPSNHGIVDAAYYTKVDQKIQLVDAVQDTTEAIVGIPNSPGYSPRKILATSLADWIVDADPNAKTLAVGSGNISSLLYSYKPSSNVYWYWNGKYVTSTYYRNDYPEWVNQFNKQLFSIKDSITTWDNSIPVEFRNLARNDAADYEGDHKNTTFPHQYDVELARIIERSPARARDIWLSWTPYLDLATLDFAKKGIEKKKLGQRNSTDYLSIVLSMVDSNSHYYGPMSMEILDTLVRLDQKLGGFLTYLDTVIGKDRYVVALTSDHGFPLMPEYSGNGRRIEQEEIERVFQQTREIVKEQSLFDTEKRRNIMALKDDYEFIADIYLPNELRSEPEGGKDDPYLQLYRNSHRTDRVPRLPFFSLQNFESPLGKAGYMVRLQKNLLIHLGNLTHGTVYDYDRKVPVIFFGNNIAPGYSTKEVRSIDIAPSLAKIAGVAYPSSVDGVSLFKK